MKLLKQSIACFVAFFIISGAALADTVTFTGTGYMTMNMEISTMSDGRNLQKYTVRKVRIIFLVE